MSIFAIYAYEAGASVSTLLFLRFLLAALLFFAWMAVKREPLGISKRQGLALFCLGGVLYTLQSLSFFSSVKYIPASMAALLLYTFPVYVAVLNYFVNKEALRTQTIGAMALSIAGLVLVLGLSFEGIQPLGVALALAAAVFYSVYFIVGNRVVTGLSPYVTSAYVSLFAALSTFGLALRDGGPAFDFGAQGWLALGGIVLFSTILAMACLFLGIQLIGSTRASVLSTLEPVVTIGCSALLFGERLGWLQLLGGCAVLLGAVLIVRSQGRQTERQTEEPDTKQVT
ncbi:DMT family transporter [Brevibacillus borstelensis]|uniref:DMT family transporter n=1 Tax=Brevibacillus borstelensis TaxID=45462 RepID=UPI0030BF8ECF